MGRKGKGSPARRGAGSSPSRNAAETPTQRSVDVYVGARLRHLREASGIELSEVSAEIGTSEECIARYERGERRRQPSDLIALTKLFGVGLNELFPEDRGQITGQLH